MSNDATPIICKADQTLTSFDDDKLGLKPLAESLTRIVQSQTDSFVLAIDSPWGTGKTTFLNMWKKMLDDQGYPCLYFNAWENDFVDDPLAAFFGELDGLVDSIKNEGRIVPTLEIIWSDAKKYGQGILKNIVPILASIATRNALSSVDINCGFIDLEAKDAEQITNTIIKDIIGNYKKNKESIKSLKNKLEEFACELRKESTANAPLVILVDELDRCRPDFAVALLERVKHVFGVKNIFFVLALDFDALSSAASRIYGQKMEDTGYLQRFFDYKLPLPEPDHLVYADNIFSLLLKDQVSYCCITIFSILSKKLHLSLRHQNRCIMSISLLFKAINKGLFTSLSLHSGEDIAHTIIMLPAFLLAFDASLFKSLKSGNSIINRIYPDPINAVRTYAKHEELILIALLWLIDKKVKLSSTEFLNWTRSGPRGMTYDEEPSEQFSSYARIEETVTQALLEISPERINYLFKLVETLGRR